MLLGATALLLGIVSRAYTGFEGCVPKLVAVLKRLRAREVGPDYTYYGIASPWLQVRIPPLPPPSPPPPPPLLPVQYLYELCEGRFRPAEVGLPLCSGLHRAAPTCIMAALCQVYEKAAVQGVRIPRTGGGVGGYSNSAVVPEMLTAAPCRFERGVGAHTSRRRMEAMSPVAAPQVKTLRLLQYFPAPEDPGVARTLNDILKKIITSAPVTSHVYVS